MKTDLQHRAMPVVMLLVAFAGGCGYRFVRADRPFGIAYVAVVPFDEPQPVGMTADLTRELARLLASGGMAVIPNRAGAQAILTGQVAYFYTRPSPVPSPGRSPRAYELSVTVNARLVGTTGRILWSGRAKSREPYLSAAGTSSEAVLITEANRRGTIQRIAELIARSLYDQLILDAALGEAG